MSESMTKELLNYSSPEISDALDSLAIEGVLIGIKPLNSGQKIAGPAYTVEYAAYEEKPTTFQGAANYIDEVKKGTVIVSDNKGREDCTVWGDLLTHTALNRGITATIVNGAVRDVADIRQTNYPVFSRAITARSGKNRVYKKATQIELVIDKVSIVPGDIVFADDNAVCVIPKDKFSEVLRRAKAIQETEDKILKAVHQGMPLEKARQEFGYAKPWQPSL